MDIVTVAQIGLGLALVVMLAWRLSNQRSKFSSKDRYTTWVAGWFVMAAGVGLAEGYVRLGFSNPRLPFVAAAVFCVGLALMLWGYRGYKAKSN